MAGEKYTKTEIVDAIYQKTGLNRKDIREVVELFIGEVKTALIKNMVMELRGFGTFSIRIRKGRQAARNPKTGEIFPVTSHGIAVFKAGRDLKQAVWNIEAGSAGAEQAAGDAGTGKGNGGNGDGEHAGAGSVTGEEGAPAEQEKGADEGEV
jgi:integration host factor subunit beta